MAQTRIRNMEQFASVSGISRPTLSKYFNDPRSVRQSTRERIEAALETHDYRPNIYAINQNRRLTRNVGIVVPVLDDPFFAEIARRLEELCVAEGYRPILMSSHGKPCQERHNLETLAAMRPAGALLAPLGDVSDRGAIGAFCADVPTIMFYSNIEGLGQAFVGSDNASFVNQTVHYLCNDGPPPCLFEMRTPPNPNAHDRRAAYLETMAARGLEPHVVQVDGQGWALEDIGRRGAHEVLERGGFPSRTILCSNDRLAIGLLSACYEKGLRVGRVEGSALRVASMDDHPFSKFTCPSLTTAAHDYAEVSARAGRALLDLIASGGAFQDRWESWVPARLVMRASA